MQTPLVSVVIVTWNRKLDVLEAVASVYRQDYPAAEAIVVDNGSTDGTVEALRATYPQATVVALPQNLGAAAGRNPGLAAARGDIVFLLDSDASLALDTLSKVVARLRADPNLGVVACKIVNASTGKLDPNAGWIYSEKDKIDQDTEFLSYSFCSAGAAIRKEVLDRVGPFWEVLFIYREEDELALRIWNAGYKVIYYPEALVYHRASPERRVAGSKREYFDLRNSLYIYVTRYPWWMLIRFVPIKIGVALVKGLSKGSTCEIVQALADVTRQFASLKAQRVPINDNTAHLYLALQREHGPLRWDLGSWLRVKAGIKTSPVSRS